MPLSRYMKQQLDMPFLGYKKLIVRCTLDGIDMV
jgi:hypothetical protein